MQNKSLLWTPNVRVDVLWEEDDRVAFEQWMDDNNPTWKHANSESQEFWWSIWLAAREVVDGSRLV